MMVHILSLIDTSPYSSGTFICNLCWEKGCGPVYHCSDCDFDVHVTCAAIAKEQTHFSHYQHPLHLCHCSTHHTCDGCGEPIKELAFRCESCDFDMHALCVRAPRFIVHPSHPVHALALTKSTEHTGPCNACNRPTTDMVYQCRKCKYSLHQYCATLPSTIKHPNHPQHPLKLHTTPITEVAPTFDCGQCERPGRGWFFSCAMCRFSIHPSCSVISHELPHSSLEASAYERSYVAAPSANQVSNIPMPCSTDLEAMERVLRFARDLVEGPSSQDLAQSPNEELEICPTCLEGFKPGNPKRSTTCGHHFHLPCILKWMERSTRCPICRKNVNVLM